MFQFLSYFQDFFHQLNKTYFLFCTLFAAAIIWANYTLRLETGWLYHLPNRPLRFAGYYLVYWCAFAIPWLLYFLVVKQAVLPSSLLAIIFLAPVIFALKVTAGGWQEAVYQWAPNSRGRYWAIVMDWPLRLLLTALMLWLLNKALPFGNASQPGNALGLDTGAFRWGPYLLLLLAMVPLVVFAASQQDFLQAYPKMKVLRFLEPLGPTRWQQFVYQLAYGTDFLTIEIFFRGLLVVAVSRIAGPSAILPMAVFYCSIHFGKPLLECISSYLGGIILGVLACYSQSILGGIVVHLGLAWMMELAAMLALIRK